MKILLSITSFAAGGAEVLCRELAKKFAREGHECHLVAVCDAATVGNSPEFEQEFKNELHSHGIGFDVLGNRARSNPIYGAVRLRQIVRAFRPDLLHAHTPHALLFQTLSLIRAPTVYTHHNSRLNFPPLLFRLFDRFVQRYVAICKPCHELLSQHTSRPIVRIVNGVSTSFSAATPREALPRKVELLSVGNLTHQKDYANLIRAAALVRESLEGSDHFAHFSIAGGGELSESLSHMIQTQGLTGTVELLGVRHDVADLMRNSHLLVNSSLFEGLPITLIEACMSALPMVATDVGGNAEIVSDGVNGYLAPPENPDKLASAIVELISDQARYVSFSKAAKSTSNKFTLDTCASEHLKLYRSLVEKN